MPQIVRPLLPGPINGWKVPAVCYLDTTLLLSPGGGMETLPHSPDLRFGKRFEAEPWGDVMLSPRSGFMTAGALRVILGSPQSLSMTLSSS